MTAGEIQALIDGIAPVLREKFEALRAQIKSLEDRLAEAEQQRAMHFRGPHDLGESYKRGAVVQRSGGVYVALIDNTTETPGASSAWRKLA